MSSILVASLHTEERLLLQELRSTAQFRRYEEIRRLLALYDAPKPVGTELDALMEAVPTMAPRRGATHLVLRSLGAEMRQAEVA